jgi:hypothetical protein
MSFTQRFFRTGIMMIVVAALYSSPAKAQVARVFLSATGNDLNICTDTSTPCRSLAEVVNQCPVNGEVIVLTSGGFGTATITKSLTINAPAGVVAFNARMITVTIAATDKVVIRGLSMNGTIFGDPSGINFTSGGTLIVENCLLTGFVNGISQSGPGTRLVVNNSEFRDNKNDGILSMPISATPTFATIEDCRFEDNGVGVDTRDYAQVVVRNSVATGNGRGYQLSTTTQGSAPFLMIDNCVASHNTFAGILANGGGNTDTPVRIRVTRSTIVGNLNGLVQQGSSQITSYGTNHLTNNGTDGTFFSTVPTI